MNATTGGIANLLNKFVTEENDKKRKAFLSNKKRSLTKMGTIYINDKPQNTLA
jgi:hypothetical protein